MVGRHVGRGDYEFRAATRANLILALALAALLALAFALGGRAAIGVMTDTRVRAAAQSYLPYVIALPLIAVFAFLFDGVFIGATRTAEMRNGMALALAAFLVAVALLMPPFGNATACGWRCSCSWPRAASGSGSAICALTAAPALPRRSQANRIRVRSGWLLLAASRTSEPPAAGDTARNDRGRSFRAARDRLWP